ncbi:hypothetical protein HYH02_007104 [Chlamydomonas schloesseri]|uniref:Protein kinase domain-containing protein n=1 Tax=Chlamydomonas schloesseri TaxID=2026947 RepID=A0A835WI75_9CHLO|nr:hypothetical protein HYH02_007104 [Chlamydomonas schloesseri]|eukprot:KAG2448079.1 hypothetical protein HYH02_007104 [Chlamydomonas schloesseri]
MLGSLSSSAAEMGFASSLRSATELLVSAFDSQQASVYLLNEGEQAYVIASSGVDMELREGTFLPSSVVSDVADVLIAAQADSPGCTVHYATLPEGAAAESDLPEEWQLLAQRHGCRHFAAVGISSSGSMLGVLSLSAKGPLRPATWNQSALCAVAALLAVQVKQAAILANALPALHAANTISQVVQALGVAAAETAEAAAHMQGVVRVAFVNPSDLDGAAAAVFPIDASAGFLAGGDRPLSAVHNTPLSLRIRRASCDLVMSPDRTMMSAALAAARLGSNADDGSHNRGKNSIDGSRQSSLGVAGLSANSQSGGARRIASFVGVDKAAGATCQGHTLALAGTLLAEALSKGAAGLCVDDCAAHVQDTKSYPRDLVLSRNAPMPLSLALATSSSVVATSSETSGAYSSATSVVGKGGSGGFPPAVTATSGGGAGQGTLTGQALAMAADARKPLIALYATFSQTLPRGLLQAVVRNMRELLLVVAPIVMVKANGALASEWECLKTELRIVLLRKKGGDSCSQHAAAISPDDILVAEGEEEEGISDDHRAVGAAGDGTTANNNNGNANARAEVTGAAAVIGTMATSPACDGAQQQGVGLSPFTAAATPPFVAAATPTLTGATAVRGGLSPAQALFGRASLGEVPATAGAAAGGTRSPRASTLKRLFGLNSGSMQPAGDSVLASAASEGGTVDTAAGGGGGGGGGFLNTRAQSSLLTGGGAGGGSGLPTGTGLEKAGSSGVDADGGSIYSGSGSGGGAKPSALRNKRMSTLMRTRSLSFRLVAAQSPRGASKLAPIISIMHERLKAAQAVQITNGRSVNRQSDLESLKLLQEVGKGGYGTVYRGTYHGSEVAVKVIHEATITAAAAAKSGKPGSAASEAAVALHKQNLHDAIELVASVSISHPNIVQVLTFFMDCRLHLPSPQHANEMDSLMDTADDPAAAAGGGGGPMPRLMHMPSLLESPAPGQESISGASSMALVMEYCDAGSLCEAIMDRVFFRQLKPTDPEDARRGKPVLAICLRSVYATLLEVALALRHMHSLHLVHCDLKPQNVLLKSNPRDSRGFTAKLSDFGLAKTMAHDDNGQLVIDEAVASGTITHVAPEVFLGKQSVGAAVDIYAFGVLMHQMLCGVKLYEGMTAQQIANAVAHDGMRPRLPSWVPSNYRALAERCWHALPSARPTADELVRQLERLGAGGMSSSSTALQNNNRPRSGYSQFAA